MEKQIEDMIFSYVQAHNTNSIKTSNTVKMVIQW